MKLNLNSQRLIKELEIELKAIKADGHLTSELVIGEVDGVQFQIRMTVKKKRLIDACSKIVTLKDEPISKKQIKCC